MSEETLFNEMWKAMERMKQYKSKEEWMACKFHNDNNLNIGVVKNMDTFIPYTRATDHGHISRHYKFLRYLNMVGKDNISDFTGSDFVKEFIIFTSNDKLGKTKLTEQIKSMHAFYKAPENEFFVFDIISFLRFFLQVPCNTLQRIHCLNICCRQGSEREVFHFMNCHHYSQHFQAGSEMRTHLQEDYTRGINYAVWDSYASIFNTTVTNPSILVFPHMTIQSITDKHHVNTPLPPFPSYVLNVPYRDYYYFCLEILTGQWDTPSHVVLIRLKTRTRMVDIFDPLYKLKNEASAGVEKYAHFLCTYLNTVNFPNANFFDTTYTLVKSSRRHNFRPWSFGALLKPDSHRYHFQINLTCMFDCILLIDDDSQADLFNRRLTKKEKKLKPPPPRRATTKEGREMQAEKAYDDCFKTFRDRVPVDETFAYDGLFNYFLKSPLPHPLSFCVDCLKRKKQKSN